MSAEYARADIRPDTHMVLYLPRGCKLGRPKYILVSQWRKHLTIVSVWRDSSTPVLGLPDSFMGDDKQV